MELTDGNIPTKEAEHKNNKTASTENLSVKPHVSISVQNVFIIFCLLLIQRQFSNY